MNSDQVSIFRDVFHAEIQAFLEGLPFQAEYVVLSTQEGSAEVEVYISSKRKVLFRVNSVRTSKEDTFSYVFCKENGAASDPMARDKAQLYARDRLINVQEIFRRIQGLTQRDRKTLIMRVAKTLEELGELSGAILSYEKAPTTEYKGKTKRDVLLEVGDVIQCIFSIGYQAGFSLHEMLAAAEYKADKWESKIREV